VVKIRHTTSFFFTVPRVSELLLHLIEELVYVEHLVTGKRVEELHNMKRVAKKLNSYFYNSYR
jgi:hypothetical protein